MGLNIFYSGCICEDSVPKKPISGNPNPFNFRVIDAQECDGCGPRVFVRFEPTNAGWVAAIKCAGIVNDLFNTVEGKRLREQVK